MGCGCLGGTFSQRWSTCKDDGPAEVLHTFPEVLIPLPTSQKCPAFYRPSLGFIEEEDGGEHAVLFLDIVLMGAHAVAAAEGACTGAEAWTVSRPPSRVASESSGTSTSTPSRTTAGDWLIGLVPAAEREVTNSPQGSGPLALPSGLSSRRSSNSSRRSSGQSDGSGRRLSSRRSSRDPLAGSVSLYYCYCQVGKFKATVHFWPVESLSHQLPSFPHSQLASTGYIALLPMESPNLEAECSSLRQRLDEVRFGTLRKAATTFSSGSTAGDLAHPRLARVALYNTEDRGVNTMHSTVETEPPDPDMDTITTGTTDIGTADLCDADSLFQTMAVKTAEWLVSCGAVSNKMHQRGSSTASLTAKMPKPPRMSPPALLTRTGQG